MSYAFLGATVAADPQVKTIQTQINTVLSANGYNAISVDGKWGPATCGALTATVNLDGGATMANALNLIGTLDTVCTASMTAPTKKGSTSKSVVVSSSTKPASASASVLPTSSGTFLGLPMNTVLIVAALAAAAYFVTSKKGK
jgi:hypothetical protein